MMTALNEQITRKMVSNYFYKLVNKFYKILPIKESGEPTLTKYILSLQMEMIGCRDLICAIHDDERYLSLLSVLQYIRDHNDEIDCSTVKSEIFRSIGIIKQLRQQYGMEG